MNRRRLHRWWLLNAVWGCVLVAWEAVLLALGLHGAWLLLPTVPLTVVQFVGRRKTRPPRPRPDYGRIAALEHELLGVEPRVRWVSPLDLVERRRADCRHERPHTLTLVNGHADTICLDCGIGLPPRP